MLPLQSPSLIVDLAREHVAALDKVTRRTAADPDRLFAEDAALAPDPLFMWLRGFIQTSPIGSLIVWVERMREEREERQFAAERQAQARLLVSRPHPAAESQEDLAA